MFTNGWLIVLRALVQAIGIECQPAVRPLHPTARGRAPASASKRIKKKSMKALMQIGGSDAKKIGGSPGSAFRTPLSTSSRHTPLRVRMYYAFFVATKYCLLVANKTRVQYLCAAVRAGMGASQHPRKRRRPSRGDRRAAELRCRGRARAVPHRCRLNTIIRLTPCVCQDSRSTTRFQLLESKCTPTLSKSCVGFQMLT